MGKTKWGVALGATAAGCLGMSIGVAHADEIGHFAGGLVNIRDYVMPPEPGFYSSLYTYYYSTNRLNDADGNKVHSVNLGPLNPKVDVDVDVFVTVPSFLWVSPWKIAGAKYGAYIAPSIATSSVEAALATERTRGLNASESNVGLGDIYVQPVWLDWSLQHWDFALGYGFYAPTGRYDVDTISIAGRDVRAEDTDNIGLGYWTHQFQGAVSWYPFDNKGTAVTAALTYEINGEKQDYDMVPGDRLSLNWGISQYLPLDKAQSILLEIGPAGYSHWQVSDDTGSDAPAADDHDQTHAVGGQIGLTIVPWNSTINFHYFHEFASEDRFQGDVMGINLALKW